MIEHTAKLIAKEANKCCDRSDGYEESIYKMALVAMQIVRKEALDEAANVCKKLGKKISNPRYYLEHDYDICAAAIRKLK